MNLRKQVGPLLRLRFRLPRYRGMHTTQPSRSSSDETLAQTSLPPSQAKQKPIRILVGEQNPVKKTFELFGPFGDAARTGARRLEMAEELVGDVERRENGQAHRVAARRRVSGGADFSVDVFRKALDVFDIERAPDRIFLPEDLDGHALGVGHRSAFRGSTFRDSTFRDSTIRAGGACRSRACG